jgi:hypothetical protein
MSFFAGGRLGPEHQFFAKCCEKSYLAAAAPANRTVFKACLPHGRDADAAVAAVFG